MSTVDWDGIDNRTLCRKVYDSLTIDNVSIPLSVILGIVVGLIVPGSSSLSHDYRPVSSIIGWIYVIAWTISFYPQVVLNYKRKRTIGLASDMLVYDFIGYVALSIYSIAMYYDEDVRDMYRDKHNGNSPAVQINDVFFAVHALFLTAVPLAQMAWYDGAKQFPSTLCVVNASVTVCLVIGYLLVVMIMGHTSELFSFFNWIYFLGFVKLAVTILKYIPQIILNFQRQSTDGWNITQIILDLMGGLFSALQLVLDAQDTGEWNGVVGNIQKVLLGGITVIFDFVFIFQHYMLYHGMAPRTSSVMSGTVYKSLLADTSSRSGEDCEGHP